MVPLVRLFQMVILHRLDLVVPKNHVVPVQLLPSLVSYHYLVRLNAHPRCPLRRRLLPS